MVPEARLEQSEGGLVASTEGWFVVNVRDAAWLTNPVLGDVCVFEGDAVPFEELGFTIAVLQPGQAGGTTARTIRRTSSSSRASACCWSTARSGR